MAACRFLTLVLTVVIASVAAGSVSATGVVAPSRPGALLAGPRGVVYVADTASHRVFAMTATGRFRVVAGNGRAGSSGDGGPAVAARLDSPAGLLLLPDGTLLIADQAANRVRAVSPAGVIRTIAGDGRFGWVRGGVRASAAQLGGPSSLALDPAGRLVIALAGANEIVRLDPDGTLSRLAGSRRRAGVDGVGRAAVTGSPDGPAGIAYDRRDDLFIAGLNTKSLLLIDRGGVLRDIGRDGTFYPRGTNGVVADAAGSVLAIDTQRLVRLSSTGERTLVDFGRRAIAGVRGFLPQGIAVAGGTVYLDTAVGNGWTDRSAIVSVSKGHVRLVWAG
jgi:hypothetical protein